MQEAVDILALLRIPVSEGRIRQMALSGALTIETFLQECLHNQLVYGKILHSHSEHFLISFAGGTETMLRFCPAA